MALTQPSTPADEALAVIAEVAAEVAAAIAALEAARRLPMSRARTFAVEDASKAVARANAALAAALFRREP